MTGDKLQRRRAIRETGTSFVVEASAGTGKTSTLVRRILRLVLLGGPDGEPLKMSEIAAITFTEKAAGQMKVRLRQKFEAFARRSGPAVRARNALRDLDGAAISTFHAFATSLLKERPFEANLDPRFSTLDQSQSDLFFREVWEPWLKRAIEERDPPLERALRSGISLGTVGDLAQTLRRHQHVVGRLNLEPPPSDDAICQMQETLRAEGDKLTRLILDAQDKLAIKLIGAVEWLRNPGPDGGPSPGGTSGIKTNWNGGAESRDRVRDFLSRAKEFRELRDSRPLQMRLHELIQWLMQHFLPEWEGRKRADGMLDFDDLLYGARELLVHHPSVRHEFHRRFKAFLVDEFQDTDAVQLDLVLLLSSADTVTADPSRLQPGPGRLFIVGDPKQSIYRFRGADIETYNSVVKEAGENRRRLQVLELTRNYRSVPSILRFVDNAFQDVMKSPEQGDYQSDYLAFGGAGYRSAIAADPAVHILAQKDGEGGISGMGRDFVRTEASRIAKLVGRIQGSEDWTVESPSGGAPSRPSYGDIAILLPVLTRANLLEDALTEAGIPFVLEGGKYYYARSEVSSAITVLLAIDNPNDSVALYGALRSIFFGLSDEDLLRARKDGLPLDYRVTAPESSPLCYPCRVLNELHERRHSRSASETLELLFKQTGAREVLATHGFQSLANLAKLTRTLRSLQQGRSFSKVVEMLQAMDEESFAEQESRLMEERSDAVRIMSIHKAKGLDFRIVIAAGLGMEMRARSESFLADPHGCRAFGLRVSCEGKSIATPGWERLKEECGKRDNAELIRLLYVALTRARDHLVISAHTAGDKTGKADFAKTRLGPLSGMLLDRTLEERGIARFIDGAALDRTMPRRRESVRGKMPDWAAVYRKECDELEQVLSRGGAAGEGRLAAEAEEAEVRDETDGGRLDPGSRGSRAIRLGVAFHEAMEALDLGAPVEAAARLAARFAARHDLGSAGELQIAAMIEATLTSGLIERARAAAAHGKRILRELPVVQPAGGEAAIEERKIDLLFEEDGGWVLVDYKTDQVPQDSDVLAARYRDQISGYRDALASLGIPVSSAYILLARTGTFLEIA
jgi:ATP-dependent helicase/nuclease subunit A